MAKFQGAASALVGLIIGALITVGSLIFSSLFSLAGAPAEFNPVKMIFGAGLAAIILMPVIYGLMGFIAGAVGAALFNLVAKISGGIEMQFEDDEHHAEEPEQHEHVKPEEPIQQ